LRPAVAPAFVLRAIQIFALSAHFPIAFSVRLAHIAFVTADEAAMPDATELLANIGFALILAAALAWWLILPA
jgi:hypothetical protein